MNIEQMSIEQLKAMAYDELSKVEIGRQNLQVLNQAIANKQSEQTKETKKEVKK